MLTLIKIPTHGDIFVNESHLIQFCFVYSNKFQHLFIHFRFQTHATFMSPLSVFSIHELQIARSSSAIEYAESKAYSKQSEPIWTEVIVAFYNRGTERTE
jgi:hypothetical protein